MKNYYRYTILAVVIAVIFLSIPVKSGNFNSFIKNTILSNKQNNQPSDTDPITTQQLKAQIKFFKQALDEFGATSPTQAAQLWAKSEETRNGVYQYAVACNNLKQSIVNSWGPAEESFWIIGGSSPWVKKHEIISRKKTHSNAYEITIKYYWATSAGDEEPTYDILTIERENNYWCVKAVKR